MILLKQQKNQQAESRLLTLPIDSVVPNPNQPRRIFDEAALRELSRSIAQYGLMQPVLVRPTPRGYELIAGERRWRACKLAGLTHIDAMVATADDATRACMALVENLQRENLHFFEEAESYLTLMKEHSLTQEELASRLGRNQSTVANKLRVLRLPPEVKKAVQAARLTERHARALLRLTDAESMLETIAAIREGLLSVKETEKLVERKIEEKLREFEGETAKKPKLVGLVRDYRLFVNTMKKACAELCTAGLDAKCRVVEAEEEYYVTVAIPKKN